MTYYEGRIILHCYDVKPNCDTGENSRFIAPHEFNIRRNVRSLFLRDEKLCGRCLRTLRVELGELQEDLKIHFIPLETCRGNFIEDLPATMEIEEVTCKNCEKTIDVQSRPPKEKKPRTNIIEETNTYHILGWDEYNKKKSLCGRIVMNNGSDNPCGSCERIYEKRELFGEE